MHRYLKIYINKLVLKKQISNINLISLTYSDLVKLRHFSTCCEIIVIIITFAVCIFTGILKMQNATLYTVACLTIFKRGGGAIIFLNYKNQ